MYISPKTDCKHVDIKKFVSTEDFKNLYDFSKNCENCLEQKENWFCFTCGKFFCSRYIKGHFLSHNENNKTHSICLSNLDLSFWCYDCDYYINNKELSEFYDIAYEKKFGIYVPSLENMNEVFKLINIEEDKARDIKYQILIEKFKNGHFKKISFITGAGISTTAGIPDFRSSESGLFKKLQNKYNLSEPEEFFFLQTFLDRPELFYDFAKEFDLSKYKPTLTHWFMSFLTHKGLLHSIFTQNIDALELKAKIPQDKIVFAHGNSNEAHCSKCRQEIDIELINKHINEGKILYCSDEKCKAPCKPKIVFYGEQLPSDFFKKAYSIQESDLAFIMGSSLKVSPFNMLPDLLGTDTWRVVINREKVGREGVSGFKYDDVLSWDLFIPGTTDEIIKQLIEDCEWSNEFYSFIESKINE